MATVDFVGGHVGRPPFDLAGVRVLVAAHSTRADLESWGAVVQRVRTSKDALVALRVDLPTVILCELDSLDVAGLHLIRQIRVRAARHGGSTPAIALASTLSQALHTRALLSGYQAALRSDVDSLELAATILSILPVG